MSLLRRTTVCAGLTLATVAVGLSPGDRAGSQAEARGSSTPARTSSAVTLHPPAPAASRAAVPPWLTKLLQVARRPVVRFIVRQGRREIRQWTREELVELVCDSWDRYYGYDVNRWYRAAWGDWRVRAAWNFCLQNGY